jgi:hypothetical protein
MNMLNRQLQKVYNPLVNANVSVDGLEQTLTSASSTHFTIELPAPSKCKLFSLEPQNDVDAQKLSYQQEQIPTLDGKLGLQGSNIVALVDSNSLITLSPDLPIPF